jgi:hypothetical protein
VMSYFPSVFRPSSTGNLLKQRSSGWANEKGRKFPCPPAAS